MGLQMSSYCYEIPGEETLVIFTFSLYTLSIKSLFIMSLFKEGLSP